MKVDNFFKNSFIVVCSNIITSIINFIFSIVLTSRLKAEGLGLYGLIMSVYMFLQCLACDGIITSMSRVTSMYYIKKDYKNLHRTVQTMLGFILVWVLIMLSIAFINSGNIAKFMIKDARALTGLRVSCLAVVFISVSAVLKGFFYGIGKFHVTAFIDIFEKMLRVITLMTITFFVTGKNTKTMVAIAYTALVVGELTSCSILLTAYSRFRRLMKPGNTRKEGRIQLIFNNLVVSVPLMANGCLSTFLASVTTLVTPRRLVHTGMNYSSALELIAKFSGMSMNIVLFPIVIVNSISTVLIPELAGSMKNNDFWEVEKRIKQVLKVSLLTAFVSLLICQCIPGKLGMIFYKRNDLETFIKVASFSSFFCFLSSSSFGIMNSLGKQKLLLRNSIIVAVEELILTYVLVGIKSVNIYGLVITVVVTSVTAFLLNLHEIKKYCTIRLSPKRLGIIFIGGLILYGIIRQGI